jgi:hypothetical protein
VLSDSITGLPQLRCLHLNDWITEPRTLARISRYIMLTSLGLVIAGGENRGDPITPLLSTSLARVIASLPSLQIFKIQIESSFPPPVDDINDANHLSWHLPSCTSLSVRTGSGGTIPLLRCGALQRVKFRGVGQLQRILTTTSQIGSALTTLDVGHIKTALIHALPMSIEVLMVSTPPSVSGCMALLAKKWLSLQDLHLTFGNLLHDLYRLHLKSPRTLVYSRLCIHR